MPGKVFIKIITQKQAHIQTVAAVAQQSTVAVDIVEITNKQYLEENHGIDAGVAFFLVILSGGFVEEIQRKFGLEFPVKIIFRQQSVQTELVEDFRCVFFLSLHMLI
mgnify:CR=1 FL=1